MPRAALLLEFEECPVFLREFEIIVFIVDAILWIRAQRWLGDVVLLIIFGSAKNNARHLTALRLLLAL